MTHTDGQPQGTGVPADDTPDSVLAGPSTWTLDPARSSASLRSKTMWGLATVRGAFGELAVRADGGHEWLAADSPLVELARHVRRRAECEIVPPVAE